MDDREIIELFFERSEQAIVELSEKYGKILEKTAYNVLGNKQDSEECVNDVFYVVWNNVPPEKPEKLLAYTARIVRNLALKKYEIKTAQRRNNSLDTAFDEISDCIASFSSVEDEVISKEMEKFINRFLASLDMRDRIMFVRRYWCGESLESLAGLFNTTKHYVSVRLSRIRKSLKRELKKEDVK